MTNVLLRVVRRVLRRLDIALDPGQRVRVQAVATNGRESAIEEFLDSIESTDPGLSAYVQGHRARIVRTLSLLPLPGPGSRALELGSYLHMAAAMKYVLGYESVRAAYYAASIGREAKSLATRGREPYKAEIDLFDAESHAYPYADASFDVVLCCELIEHLLHDPMHLLVECRRVLSEDGLLVVTTPNTASLSSIAAVLDGRHNPQVFSRYPAPGNPDIPHVREYTPDEIARALAAAGFQIEVLITERMAGAQQATWVEDILKANDFDTSLRGEQIYCLARKRSSLPVERYPPFLYSPRT